VSKLNRVNSFTLLGWILAIVMFLFLSLVIVPKASGNDWTRPPRARLLFEIKDERVRIFEYETPRMLCHLSIIDVKMIGSQASVSCVRKDVPKYRSTSPFQVPLHGDRPVE
jgi:hypothetical protein